MATRARILNDTGDLTGAARLYEQSAEIYAAGRYLPDLARVLIRWAKVLESMGNAGVAATTYERAASIVKGLPPDHPRMNELLEDLDESRRHIDPEA